MPTPTRSPMTGIQSFSMTYLSIPAMMIVALFAPTAIAVQVDATTEKDTTQLTSLLYQSSISAAEKAMRFHELREARKWLDHAPEKLRGWEWEFLNARCDESLSSFPVEQKNITALDVSADGKRVALATADGSVTLYSLPGFTDPTQIGGHREAVYSVVFSEDASRLVTVSRDVTSRVWDVETGREISQIRLDNPGVAEACFSPSGKHVATCSWMMTSENGERQVHGTVWVWNAETGEIDAKQRVGVKPLDSIQWSDDGSKIVVGSWDGLVHVLDSRANLLKTLTVPVEGAYTAVISVAISDDGMYIAAGSKDRNAYVWLADSGDLVATMRGHDGDVTSLRFIAGGQHLVTASVDGTCRIWATESGKSLQVLHGHAGSVTAIDVVGSGRQMVSMGRDQQIRLWDLKATYGAQTAFRIQPDGTYTTTFSADGSRLFIACYDGHVRVVDSKNGAALADWIAHDGSCNSLALSHDGSRLLTCSWDKTAKVWNTADNRLAMTIDAAAGIYDCAISPDGSTAALCIGNKLQLWNLETGEKTGECEGHKENLSEVAFAPDGRTVATAASGEQARIWNAATCELVATPGTASDAASSVLFSHDGLAIATGHRGVVNIWDCGSYTHKQTIPIGDSPVSQLSFSADDTRLAIASDAVYLIDPQQGVSLLRFQPNVDDIYFLAFSPDGSRLATCTTSGSVTISETVALSKRFPTSISSQEK